MEMDIISAAVEITSFARMTVMTSYVIEMLQLPGKNFRSYKTEIDILSAAVKITSFAWMTVL